MLFKIFAGLFTAGLAAAQTACNGNAALCDRLYSNVSLVGAHDSAFVGDLVTENQHWTVTEQLDNGIRFLTAQTHDFLDEIMLCHTSCFELDAGLLVTYLTSIATWMDSNPNEVVTLLLTNGDDIDVSRYGTAMDSAGLSKYAYTPPSQLTLNEWPTLQELIDAGTRLVMFMDYNANTAEVSYILDEFSYIWETSYDVTDPTFSDCSINRPAGSTGAGLMYIINHFLDINLLDTGILIPDEAAAATTNAATGTGSIGAEAALCESLHGARPNFVLVDYTDLGDVFTAQNNLNGL